MTSAPIACTGEWLDTLLAQPARHGVADPRPPDPGEAEYALDLLAVPAADRPALLAAVPDPERDPRRWEALVRCHQALFADPRPPDPSRWPHAPAELGARGRYFYAALFVLAVPRALDGQRGLGVPDQVVRDTFADLGSRLTDHRLTYGAGGFDRQTWIARHFRGTLHRLGRLQFERRTYDSARWGAAAAPAGGPAEGEPVLDVHIPGDGPLTPAACDASLAAAGPFMARHHGQRYTFAACHSWLLDPALADDLPPDANILGFQRRFTPHGDRPVGDDSVLSFVFHAPPGTTDLTALPARNTLQRAVLDRLRTGGHWHVTRGWTRLP